MRYLDEYRDPQAVAAYLREIERAVTRDWRIMEVCGGQTHAIVRHGLDQLLPDAIELIHGPGCPVCVTPVQIIDAAVRLALQPEVIFCSFGDMLRVPGSEQSLSQAKAQGADVRVVYSPLDALALAGENPDRKVVFFAVGFETTAPANAMAAFQAREKGIGNFSLLVSHYLVPPAIDSILRMPDTRIDGFLAAGHVCTVMGYEAYRPLAERYGVPIVVTGFEPLDILEGVLLCVQQLEAGHSGVENQYARSVRSAGNPTARSLVETVFSITDRLWRGIGGIAASGLELAPAFADLCAIRRFGLSVDSSVEEGECISGRIMQGLAKPADCPHFGRRCTPEHPVGAPMVSSEGACAAYYRHRAQAEP